MAAAATCRLRMQGIRKAFGATLALGGVDLAVAAGEVHALIGENGAGKSTLMKVLSGALVPDAGELWLDGAPFRPCGPHDARLAGVAMIYQELSLAPHLTVAENILLGMEPIRWGCIRRAELHRRAAAALAQLGRPDLAPDTLVAHLPIATRQLVEIARAIAVGCRVLVLDEPTSSLAAADIAHLFTLVRRLRGQGLAIVYISHVFEEVTALADRYTVLRDGQSVGSGPMAGTAADQLIAQMVGRAVAELYPRSPHRPGEPLLTLRELGGRGRLLSASLTLHRGEVLGIAGLVGAGRSELLRAIFGLDPVRRGEVRIGAHRGAARPARRWAQGVGMVSEDRKREGLALALSVADNLTLSRLGGRGPLGLIRPARLAAAAGAWCERLQIKCRHPAQPVGQLSGGNQQKVALGRLLHHEVDILLLDEPTRGIDVGSKAQLYRLIDQLASQGKAVLLVSSYLPELLGTCDRIAVMTRGALGPARPVADCTEHSLLQEAIG